MSWLHALLSWWHRPQAVSGAWLAEQRLSATKTGWDGPRWRLPEERSSR